MTDESKRQNLLYILHDLYLVTNDRKAEQGYCC